MVAISAFVDGARRDGRDVDFTAPADASRSRYLTRMGLADLLEDMRMDHDLRAARKLSRGDNLVELQRFHAVGDVEMLFEDVEQALGRSRATKAMALTIGIYEAGANVPRHADVDSDFLAAQQTHEGSRFSYAVGDAGGLEHCPRKADALFFPDAQGGTAICETVGEPDSGKTFNAYVDELQRPVVELESILKNRSRGLSLAPDTPAPTLARYCDDFVDDEVEEFVGW